MQRALMPAGLAVAGVLAVVWLLGGFSLMQHWVAGLQRDAQEAMAAAVRALRGGQSGAAWWLLVLAFGYGVAHAAGPGHGKVLIGSYGVAARVSLLPLAAIAIASSLAQAAVAVGLVYATVAVLGWTRDRVLGAAQDVMAPLGHVLIAGLGMWLLWRGVAGLRRQVARDGQAAHHHVTSVTGHSHVANVQTDHDHAGHAPHGHPHHNHAHPHDPSAPLHPEHHVHDETCSHPHGPTLDQISALTNWRDVLALIAGIAIRPCSGALFLLILTWQLGIGAAGVAGAFAMGLGTAVVTVAMAGLAVWAREGAFATLSGTRIARAVPVLEMLAGAVIVIVAVSLFGVAG